MGLISALAGTSLIWLHCCCLWVVLPSWPQYFYPHKFVHLVFQRISSTNCCPRSCTSELLLRELSILCAQQWLQSVFNFDKSNWCMYFPLQHSFVYCIFPVSVLVTYIMHIVHAVKSLQGPGVTSLRFRFKTVHGCTWVDPCQDRCLCGSPPVVPDSFARAGRLWGEAVWGSQVRWGHHCFALLLLQEEAAKPHLLLHCPGGGLRWAGAAHFSLLTLEELHWQRSSRAEAFHDHTLEMSTLQEHRFLVLGNSDACHVSNFASETRLGEHFLIGAMRGKRGVPYHAMPCIEIYFYSKLSRLS